VNVDLLTQLSEQALLNPLECFEGLVAFLDFLPALSGLSLLLVNGLHYFQLFLLLNERLTITYVLLYPSMHKKFVVEFLIALMINVPLMRPLLPLDLLGSDHLLLVEAQGGLLGAHLAAVADLRDPVSYGITFHLLAPEFCLLPILHEFLLAIVVHLLVREELDLEPGGLQLLGGTLLFQEQLLDAVVHFIQFEIAVSANLPGLVQRKLGQNLSVFLALTRWDDPPLADGSSSRCVLRLIENLLRVDSIIYALAHPLIRNGRHVAIVLVFRFRLQSVIGLLLGVLVQ
jgi:hypothetical protein